MPKSNVIRVSINAESINAKGYFYDSKENHCGFTRTFQSEETMRDYFYEMKFRDCDFQLVIERKA